MGSSPSWQPGSDNCGTAADTTLDCHHHAGNDNHDHKHQPILESLNEELLILQKKNEIIKLQKERASIMELTPAAYNLPYNPKYPVT